MPIDNCANCAYWDVETNYPPNSGRHCCRRYPPEIVTTEFVLDVHKKLPFTDSTHWCGEWKKK